MTQHQWANDPHPPNHTRALAALLAMIALVAGVPLLLMWLARALPLDPSALAPSAWAQADDGGLLLFGLLGVAWAAWAVMLLSVALETWSVLRLAATPRLPGLAAPQRLASGLVAALLVSLTAPTSSAVPAVAVDRASQALPDVARQLRVDRVPSGSDAPAQLEAVVLAARVSDAVQSDPDHLALLDRQAGAGIASVDETPANDLPTLTTKRHDTLWLLAEQYLGAGERYPEIVDLNKGEPQPDGRALRDDGRVYPGWSLALPRDAVLDNPRPDRHRVDPGETLWAIAEDELGDATRFPEIARLNEGDRQADGRTLQDPDLIQPGWILKMPADGGEPLGGTDAEAADDLTSPKQPQPEPPPIDRDADLPAPSRGNLAHPAPDETPTSLDRGSAGGNDLLPDGLRLPPLDAAVPAPSVEPDSPLVPDASEHDGVSTEHASEPPSLDPASGAAALAGGSALASLMLAGVGLELLRRRRQYQRHRMPGERMPVPDPRSHGTEQAARAALRLSGPDLLQRSLIALAAAAERKGRPVPDVRLVRLGSDSVVLELATPTSEPLDPFRALTKRRWVLDRALLAADSVVDVPRALPGLVTLGTTGPQTLLVNMESVGTLVLSGGEEVLAGVVRGFAAELAYGPASQTTERTLCVSDPWVAATLEAGSMTVETDPDALNAMLTSAMELAGVPGGDASELPAGGPQREVLDRDPLHIVLSDKPVSAHARPFGGCALITTAAVPHTPGASLVVEDSGAAVLLPEHERLMPQTLSASAAGDLVGLMSTTELPAEVAGSEAGSRQREPLHPHHEGSGAGEARTSDPGSRTGPGVGDPALPAGDQRPTTHPTVIDLPDQPNPETASRPPSPVEAPVEAPVVLSPSSTAPRILLLGQIEVENARGKAESTRIGRLAETAAFVLLQPGARPSELQTALWPGRRSNPQTCRQMISRTRTWLGRTAAGTAHLMPFALTEGRLRLSDEVSSDWADFRQLAKIGLADPNDTAHLEAALRLVRGRPFGSVAARELPWADLHINEMISAITDVAHELATRHERAGRRSAAHDAALRGLLTECEAEILEEMATRTAP